jgi:zinc protease
MIRHPRIARAAIPALVLALIAAACGGAKPPAAGPGPGAAAAAGSARPPAPAPAPAPAARDPEDARLPLWSEVKHGQLANGLTYYVLKHGKPEKRGFLWLAVNAGSVQEDDDQRGLAHFDEHMAFNGTRRFPKAEIVNYLEKIGMRFGADLNARTSFDDTVYELEVPTDDPAYVAKGLDILHDWAGDVAYDPAEVDRERGVVLEEWRLGRGAQQRLFDKQAPVLFKGSRYAVRLPIGLPEIIKTAPRDRLHRFYKDWYRPDLMAVIAVGDFDPGAIEQEIQRRFGDLKNPEHERPRISAGVPAADGTRVSIETDREMPATVVSVYNIMPHRPESSFKDFRRITVEQVYQTILNERFGMIGRRREAPFVNAGAGIESPTREIDAFAREAQAKAGQAEATLESLFTEVLRVEQHGVTQSELDRARAILERFYLQNEVEDATSDSRNYTEEFTRNFFEGEFMVGRKRESELARKYLATVTLAEMNSLAKSFGGAANRVILIDGPPPDKAAALPTRERVLAIIDEVGKRQIEPWEDKAVTAKLMPQLPRPGKIVKEARREAVNVTEWTLGNGARVVIKPTDYEADRVALLGSSPGGVAMASDKAYPDARFADDIAAVGGVGDHDPDELGKLLAGKHATASAEIGETTESISAGASVKDLETMFQLVHLEMTAPRKDDAAIAVWRQNLKEQLANRMRVPEVQFSIQSQTELYHGNPRRLPAVPGDIDKVDADRALAFYKDRFGDATDFTFVIVGAFDPAQLRPLVETYLASLPARGRREKEKDLGIRKARGVVKHAWMLGQEPNARVSVLFHGDDAWTRDKDRDLFILSQVLEIRLREVLREDKGGVYGVNVGGALVRAPHPERDFSIAFGCDPLRVTELINAMFDEIAQVQKAGIGPDYLEKIKQTFTRERETQLRSNGFWIGWLTSAYTYGDDPALVLDPSKMIARMTSDNVKAAAKRYLDPKQYFEPILLPAK